MKAIKFFLLLACTNLALVTANAQQTGPNDSPVCGPAISSCGDCDPQFGTPVFSSEDTAKVTIANARNSIAVNTSAFYRTKFKIGVQTNCGTSTGDNSISISFANKYHPVDANAVKVRVGNAGFGVIVNTFSWTYDPATYTLLGESTEPLSGQSVGGFYDISVEVFGFVQGVAGTSINWFSEELNQPPGDQLTGNSTYATNLTVTAALPTKLFSFNAVKITDKEAKVNWVTSYEQNAAYYEVEYSKDGLSWNKIGTVQANGNTTSNTNYSLPHDGLIVGANYYRLKMFDLDGNFTYSIVAILKVDGKGEQNSMSIYPNPVKSNTSVSFKNTYRGKAMLVITDAAGKRLQTIQTVVNAGINVKPINTSNLAAGNYMVSLIDENGKVLNNPIKMIVSNY